MSDGFPISKSGRNSGGNETVVTVQLRRGDTAGQFNQVVQLHHFTFITTNIDAFQVGRLVALLAVDFTQYFVLLSVHIEITHTLTAQSVLKRLRDIACAYSHDTCLVAIDIDAGFRLAEFQVHVGHLENRIFINLRHKYRQHLL